MTIDIIAYTDEQLAALSAEKLLEVREAQLKKDALEKALQENLEKEKQKLIDKGAYPSDVWGKIEMKMKEECEKEIGILRDSLVFFLHFVADDAPVVLPDVPYKVDYSLSEGDRMYIVREYYETTYANDLERYEAFKRDEFAKVYLGELYAPLHDYFYATE